MASKLLHEVPNGPLLGPEIILTVPGEALDASFVLMMLDAGVATTVLGEAYSGLSSRVGREAVLVRLACEVVALWSLEGTTTRIAAAENW